MHKHDAQAYARACPEHDARLDATYVLERTHALTQMDLPSSDISSFVSRAGGLEDFPIPGPVRAAEGRAA